jgi:MFS transporter, OFA family, oxalate/formate antiporter
MPRFLLRHSAALIFLTWGEIFSLFPSTCTDSFGTKFATVNLSLLYTAKGTSAFLVPVSNVIKASTGSWHTVFVVTAGMNFVVVGLALFALKPMRSRLRVSFWSKIYRTASARHARSRK